MQIVLDTNILQEDFLLRTSRFEILFDFVARTRSSIVLPRLVFDELVANYGREFHVRAAKLTRSAEQLNGLLLKRLDRENLPNPQDAAASYGKYIIEKLGLRPETMLPLRPEFLDDVVNRAIHRKAPCTSTGEEMRDALLWCTVVALACGSEDRVTFISRNTRQFTSDNTTLHPDLAAELRIHGATIEYFTSLEAFAKAHATPIAFVTKQWLEAQIHDAAVLDRLQDRLEASMAQRLERRLDTETGFTGYVSLQGGALEVIDYYMYQMLDGSLRVESLWSGHVTFEYEVTESPVSTLEWEYGFNPMTGDVDYHPAEVDRPRARSRETEGELMVAIEGIIRDGALVSWTAQDQWLE